MPAGQLVFRPTDMTAPRRLIGAPAPRHSGNAVRRMVGKSAYRSFGMPVCRHTEKPPRCIFGLQGVRAPGNRLAGMPSVLHVANSAFR